MLKKHMTVYLFATALAATPAWSQAFAQANSGAGGDRPAATGTGSATMGSPSMRPGASTETGAAPLSGSSSAMGASNLPSTAAGSAGSTTAPSGPATGSSTVTTGTSSGSTAGSSASNTAGSMSGNFITQQSPNQFLASRLIGTNVVGGGNEAIGDVNDVLMDRNGQAVGVVIGVGGFLGIGEKNVAVPFNQLELASANAAGSGGSSGTTGATTGTNANAGTAPDRIVLRMTKEQLQNAPGFATAANRDGNASTTGSTATSGAGGSGTNPSSGTAPSTNRQ